MLSDERHGTGKTRSALRIVLFVAPVLLPLGLFWIWPTLRAAFVSFTDWDYMTPSYNFTGLKQYGKLLASGEFLQALKNTTIFCVSSTVLTVSGGLLLGSLLRRAFRGSTVFKVLFFSPWVTPTVAVSLVWMWIFDEKSGIANAVLNFFQLPALKWIGSSETAMLSVIIVTVWQTVGYAMVFYIGALDKVPASLYEAAALDRTSKWQMLTKITLPYISPTTVFLTIITTVNGLQAYDQIQMLTQGGPSGSTRTLLYLFYQLGFERYKMGQATALAVILALIGIGLSVLQNSISKKFVYY